MHIREELENLIAAAFARAVEDGSFTLEEIPAVTLERPRDASNGDWACTDALHLAREMHMNPRNIAQTLVDHLPATDMIEKVGIAGPGFINFTVAPRVFQDVVAQVRAEGPDYAKSTLPEPCKVDIEYISANPTGPFHVGHGRWAALGDATARVMRHAGYEVYEENYVNDHGVQMDNFAASVVARYLQLLGHDAELPESSYAGSYVKDIAQAIIDQDGDAWEDADEAERLLNFRERAYAYELAEQHRVCDEFGTHFDTWFSERTLYEEDENGKSKVDYALEAMDSAGYVYGKDDAIWFRSTAFGDDKDRVLKKANGEYTYFTSDVAYHYDKVQRGFDRLIDIWGADHHGYIARCEAMLSAWGYPGILEVMLGQLVNLYRNGKPVRMSKRTGEMITFEEVIDEVGVDSTRWLMLSRSADQAIDFDIEEAKKQDASNPVYYVQYAHARICSILRNAAPEDLRDRALAGSVSMDELSARVIPADVDLSVLVEPSEVALMRKMETLGEFIALAARDRAAFRLTHFSQDMAGLFHVFYTNCHVLSDDKGLQNARLALIDSVRIVLEITLGLLGISAPIKM